MNIFIASVNRDNEWEKEKELGYFITSEKAKGACEKYINFIPMFQTDDNPIKLSWDDSGVTKEQKWRFPTGLNGMSYCKDRSGYTFRVFEYELDSYSHVYLDAENKYKVSQI